MKLTIYTRRQRDEMCSHVITKWTLAVETTNVTRAALHLHTGLHVTATEQKSFYSLPFGCMFWLFVQNKHESFFCHGNHPAGVIHICPTHSFKHHSSASPPPPQCVNQRADRTQSSFPEALVTFQTGAHAWDEAVNSFTKRSGLGFCFPVFVWFWRQTFVPVVPVISEKANVTPDSHWRNLG